MRISDWSSDVCSSDLAVQVAKLQGYDVLMLDTAGRLHVDQQLMDEMQAVSRTANPAETLLVVDSLTGQDAVQVAQRRSEERRVGKECGSTCRYRGSPYH